ncbi:MAG: hypothetical protein V3S70_08415, partial [Gammaproteobacteria bacterium]
MSIIKQLKRRNVFRFGVAYVVTSWAIITIVDVMFPALKLPDWTVTFVTALLIVGFPIAII